jgi:hypothetical protein
MANPKDSANLHVPDIDRTAPAGSEHSLGAQSVRDGRPATDDSVVEAMDEEGLGRRCSLRRYGVFYNLSHVVN